MRELEGGQSRYLRFLSETGDDLDVGAEDVRIQALPLRGRRPAPGERYLLTLRIDAEGSAQLLLDGAPFADGTIPF